MTISPFLRRKLEERDKYCIHCGETDNLVIHHRKNRGMGGSKIIDVYENLIRVCQEYNSAMESDSVAATYALEYGHKLRSWQDFTDPVFDRCDGEWYQLNADGTKETVWKLSQLF